LPLGAENTIPTFKSMTTGDVNVLRSEDATTAAPELRPCAPQESPGSRSRGPVSPKNSPCLRSLRRSPLDEWIDGESSHDSPDFGNRGGRSCATPISARPELLTLRAH